MQKKDKLTNNSSGVFIVEGPKCNRWKEAGKIQKYHSCDVFSYSLVVSNNTQSVNPNSHISGAHFESIQTVFTTATCIISSLNTGRQKQKFALLLNIQVVFDTCFCTFIPVFIWDQNQKHQHATRQSFRLLASSKTGNASSSLFGFTSPRNFEEDQSRSQKFRVQKSLPPAF